MSTHIAQANAKNLDYDDIVEQAGVPYRVTSITGFTNGFGFQLEAVFLVPTHNLDGDPMPSDGDVYRSVVHTATGTLAQIRWFGTQASAAAYLVNRK